MTLASEIRQVIVNSIEKLPNVSSDQIHTFGIKANDWTDDKPVFLITEISNNESGYGDNEATYLQQQAQVQIYYSKDYVGDMDDLENQLKQVMRSDRYYCFSDNGHILTPDDGQLMATLKFNHKK